MCRRGTTESGLRTESLPSSHLPPSLPGSPSRICDPPPPLEPRAAFQRGDLMLLGGDGGAGDARNTLKAERERRGRRRIIVFSVRVIKRQELPAATTHGAFSDALLPLAHPDALLQRGALLQQQVPAAVRIPGADAGSARRVEIKRTFILWLLMGFLLIRRISAPTALRADATQNQTSGRAGCRLKRGVGAGGAAAVVVGVADKAAVTGEAMDVKIGKQER